MLGPGIHHRGRAPRPPLAQQEGEHLHVEPLLPRRLPQCAGAHQRRPPRPHTTINPAAAFETADEGYSGTPFPRPPRDFTRPSFLPDSDDGGMDPGQALRNDGQTRRGPRRSGAGCGRAAFKRLRRSLREELRALQLRLEASPRTRPSTS